jgi:peptidoglycan/xylan/chitin deacetylase (PgdA/CDA1 family)
MGETYTGPRPPVKWPNEARIAVSVTIAFEQFVYQGHYGGGHTKPGMPNPFSLSYNEYGAKVGVWRILEALDRHKIKATFDIGGLAAERHPAVLRALRERGHEAAGHGWANELHPRDGDAAAERKVIRDTIAAIESAYGERPVGWVGPGSFGSEHTMQFMIDEGMLWNGDDASDDVPFVRYVANKPIVIVPRVNFPTNDLIICLKPQNPGSVYFDSVKETFDYMYEEGRNGSPKWIDLLLHCDIGGRPAIMGPFERALRYIRGFDGVWFARRRDLAEWTMKSAAN